jgi:hypothetical protein
LVTLLEAVQSGFDFFNHVGSTSPQAAPLVNAAPRAKSLYGQNKAASVSVATLFELYVGDTVREKY